MEIPSLIAAIVSLCGVIGYLYRKMERLQHVVVKGLEADLREANAEIKRLRGD